MGRGVRICHGVHHKPVGAFRTHNKTFLAANYPVTAILTRGCRRAEEV